MTNRKTLQERTDHFRRHWAERLIDRGADGIAELLDLDPEVLGYLTEEHGSLTGLYLAAVEIGT